MIFHAKSLLGTEKVTTTKICQIQFHTAFAALDLTPSGQLRFNKNDLDGLDSPDKYPDTFHLLINLDYKANLQAPQVGDEPWANRDEFDEQVRRATNSPQTLFTSHEELNILQRMYDSSQKKVYSDESATPKPVNQTNFLSPRLFDDQDDSSSPLSSRSASPMPIKTTSHEMPTANLLGLDMDDNTAPPAPQTQTQPVHNLASNFDLLLDLGVSGPAPVTQTSTSSNNFDANFDLFAPTTTQNVASNANDLLGFDVYDQSQPKTGSQAPPLNPNMMMYGMGAPKPNTIPVKTRYIYIKIRIVNSKQNTFAKYRISLIYLHWGISHTRL